MTTTRIYQLDTIEQSDIKGTHVAPFEDNSGYDTTQISLSQLTQYFFNSAALTDDSGPFGSFPLVCGPGNTITDVEGATNVTILGFSNEVSRDDGGGTTGITTIGVSNNVISESGASTVGNANTTWGPSTTVCGYHNTGNGPVNSVFGCNNLVSGVGCTGAGYENVAYGEIAYSTVVGAYNQITSPVSTAVGYNNQVNVPCGSAFGSGNNVFGLYSQAVGFRNFTSQVTWSYTQFDISSMNKDNNIFSTSGNQTNYFLDLILVSGNENPLNNGVYEIESVGYNDDGGGNTNIYVSGTILGDNSNSGFILSDLNFTAATEWPIYAVNTESNIFQVLGDHLVDYENSDVVEVSDSSYNDGYYPVNNVYYNDDGGGHTNIYVGTSIPSGTADGNITGNKADEDLGWGASAFGYKNSVTDSQSQAFGHYNAVNARLSSAFGTYNSTNSTHSTTCGYYNIASDYGNYEFGGSGWGASALGYKNQALGSQTSALGHKNIAFGRGAVACGYTNTASEYYSIAIGVENTASGYSSTAIGTANQAIGIGSVACGYECISTGNYSTAFGCYAVTRPEKVVNIGGAIITRADNGEDSGDEFTLYSGTNNIVMTKDLDLTQTTTYTITVPTGCSFYVDEVGIITDGTPNNVTGQPIIAFGWTGSLNGLVSSVITTNLVAQYSREVYTGLGSYDGLQSLVFSVNNGASVEDDGNLTGRAYWKGMLIENTPIS